MLHLNLERLLFTGAIDWESAPIKAALFLKNTWTPAADDGVVQDIVDAGATELTSVGYARVSVATTLITSPAVIADADTISFDGPPDGGDDYDALVIYLDVTDDTDSPVLATVEFSTATTNGLPIEFPIDDGGLFDFAAATPGGPEVLEVIRFPFTFDTPGLMVVGIPFYTPTPGDIVTIYNPGAIFITEAFDGAGPPAGHIGYAGAPDAWDATIVTPFGLDAADPTTGGPADAHLELANYGYLNGGAYTVRLTDDEPLTLMVDDRAGGDPGSSQGAAELVLIVLHPPG